MGKIKKSVVILALVFCTMISAKAQSRTETLDSLEAFKPVLVDSALIDKSIFNVLPSKYNGYQIDIKIHQSESILNAMKKHMLADEHRVLNGYRVRIYFDNNQKSRTESESVLFQFRTMYPSIPAYRSYQNPFFKVTVGDFRTKSEALRLLSQIKGSFPSAFVVKDEIQYPL